MAARGWFVGLDIGSTTITAAAVERGDLASLSLAARASAPSRGVQAGRIVDPDAVREAIVPLLRRLEQVTGQPVESVALSVPGSAVRAVTASAERRWAEEVLVDQEILVEMRCRALRGPRTIGTVLVAVDRGVTVDGIALAGETSRLRARTARLELRAYVAPDAIVDERAQVLGDLGTAVDVLVPRAVASAEAVLRRTERELGAAVIDVGGTSTDVAVYVDGQLQELFTLPVGAELVTRDIMTVVRESRGPRAPDRLGGTPAKAVSGRRRQRQAARQLEPVVPVAEVARQVVQFRLMQVFTAIRRRLEELDLGWRLGGGAVVVGGGARLLDAIPIARRALEMPARLGMPPTPAGSAPADPSLTTVAGLVLAGARIWPPEADEPEEAAAAWSPLGDKPVARPGVVPALGRWLREFVPLGEGV